MDELLKCILRATSGNSVTKSVVRSKLKTSLSAYSSALERSLPRLNDEGMFIATRKYQELEIHHKMAQIMLNTFSQSTEMVFDRHEADFRYILAGCQRSILMDQSSVDRRLGPFMIRLGDISPLFFVATRCRNGPLRHQAIELLHSLLRSEQNWNSCTATAIARFVAMKEGQRDPRSETILVPESQRIRLISLSFDRANQKIIIGYNQGTFDDSSQVKMEVISGTTFRTVYPTEDTIEMMKKVVRAAGYSGRRMTGYHIECGCVGP